MYENKTYESILQEKLARIASIFDKREGSIIYDALAPNSLESAMIYVALDTILNETFADTASREYLILRCRERGISPYAATPAHGIGVFNINVPIGSRFSCDKYNWIVTEFKDGKHYLTCETAGTDPNGYIGQLIPIDYIDGLTFAELTEIVINGEDEEDTEALRLRYLNSFVSQSYGFNRAQYIEVVEALQDVGICKPYRACPKPGHVKLVITDSNYSMPSHDLIAAVQNKIDPPENNGEGLGLAPIDHVVTVCGVMGEFINISTTLTFAPNYSFEICRTAIETALDAYYKELNSTWKDKDNLRVLISQINSLLLGIIGIEDVSDTTLNNQSGNLVLDVDTIALRGEFTNNA